MFPHLDVDFHLAPFVDPRDHLGVAAARVTIGAPHFDKPREFWVRPLRVFASFPGAGNGGIGVKDVLIRPVEMPKNHLLLMIGNAHLCIGKEDEPKFLVDLISRGAVLARHWRHPDLPLAVRLNSSQSTRGVELFPLQMSQEDAYKYEDPLQLSPDELLDWPIEKIHDSIERQFADENSELQVAWNWAQIPRNERFKAFFARPEWRGFLHLMRCILISQAFLSPVITQSGATWRFLEDHVEYIQVKSKPPQFLDSKRCKIWLQAILDIYQRRETQTSAPIKMLFAHYNFRPIYPIICSPPTHHEMLEARLQLHEWARAHLPPSRAAELIALDDLN